ncbi:MAG: MBL fold metallo-hydrolase [Rhizobiaceae bacterium]
MTVTRRTLLKTTTAAAAIGALPFGQAAWAKSSTLLGKIKIDVLSDGHMVLPVKSVYSKVPEKDYLPVLKSHGITTDAINADLNLTLVRDGKNTILFDVGAGPNFMPTSGKLGEALEALELDPSEVTHVVFTHAHPDHLWGLLDDFDEPLFSEAKHMIGKAEWDYWIDPKTMTTIGEERQVFAAGAARNLKAIEEQISFFKFGEEILPGVMARDAVGHTPGHSAFEVRSGSESLMIVGDAITNDHMAFEYPKWHAGFDQDDETAVKTRLSLLDQLATEKQMIIGYHLPHPGIGRVEKKDNAYKFVAA